MTIQIPRQYTNRFKDFFSDFDNDLIQLDIQSYGVSVTTLEQVFLEIGNDPNPQPKILDIEDDPVEAASLPPIESTIEHISQESENSIENSIDFE